MGQPIRVLIAEGNQAICHALCRLLRQAQEIDIVAVASDGGSALQFTAQYQPTVALLGTGLSLFDGRPAIPSLYQRFPQVRIVGLGIYPSLRESTLAAGACRFTMLDAPLVELIASIQLAAAGECQSADVPDDVPNIEKS